MPILTKSVTMRWPRSCHGNELLVACCGLYRGQFWLLQTIPDGSATFQDGEWQVHRAANLAKALK